MMFSVIEDATVITKSRGIYRQGKMYERAGRIYVGWSNGFISVHKAAGKIVTSIPDVLVDEYILPFTAKFTKVGQMVKPDFEEKYQTADEVNAIISGSKGKKP